MDFKKSLSFVNNLSKSELSRLAKCNANNSTSRRCEKLVKKKAENTTVLTAGLYNTKVNATNSKITVKVLNGDNDTLQSFQIKMSKKNKEDAKRGIIDIKAKDSGFNYDIIGEIDEEITYSDTYEDYEYCTYTTYHKKCHRERDEEGNKKKVCKTISKSHPGEKHVEYRYVYTDKDLQFDAIKANSEVIGEFSGQYHDTDKDYLHRGSCHRL